MTDQTPVAAAGVAASEAPEMADDPFKVNTLILFPGSDPSDADVRWDPVRSLWNRGMMLAALVFGPPTFARDAVLVFLATSAFVLCTRHSVGFHRRLIHRSFDCPKWLERLLVWSGTAVMPGAASLRR